MSSIRELSFDEIIKVSGGEGHGSEVAQDKRDRMNAQRNSRGGAPVTTANNVGFVIIGGTLTAIATIVGGPVPGAIVGTAVSAAVTALPQQGSSSSNKGGGWHDTNPGGMVGQCRW